MKQFIAIMSWTQNNRIAKFQDFTTRVEALVHVTAHLSDYPLAFTVTKPNEAIHSWLINPLTETVSVDFPPPVIISPAVRIAAITEGDDFRVVIFKMLFKLHRRILTLENKPTITVAEFLTALEDELS